MNLNISKSVQLITVHSILNNAGLYIKRLHRLQNIKQRLFRLNTATEPY